MFPSYNSVSEKERKRQELLKSIQDELKLDAIKEQAYAEAVWADDNKSNKINVAGENKTASTQTDSAGDYESFGDQFRRFFDEFFQRQGNNESGNRADRGRSYDASVDGVVSTADNMSDIDDVDSNADITDMEVDVDEAREQYEAIEQSENGQNQSLNYLKALLQAKPEIASWGIRVVSRDSGRLYRTAFIGKNAEPYTYSGRRSTIDPDNIDWVATERYVNNVVEHIDKSDYQRARDDASKMLGRESKAFSVLKGLKNERLNREDMAGEDREIPYPEVGISTDLESESYQELINLFSLKSSEMKRLYAYIHPVTFEGNVRSGYRLTLASKDGEDYIKIVKPNQAYDHPKVRTDVSWSRTLQMVYWRAKELGINLDIENIDNVYITPQKRNMTESPDLPRNRKNLRGDIVKDVGVSNLGKNRIMELMESAIKPNPWLESGEYKFKPSVKTKHGVTESKVSYLGVDDTEGLTLYNLNGLNMGRIVDKKRKEGIMRSIDWPTTYERFINHLFDIADKTSDRSVENGINSLINQLRIMADHIIPSEDIEDFNVRHTTRRTIGSGSGLRGRGLRGAGRTTLNLRRKRFGS